MRLRFCMRHEDGRTVVPGRIDGEPRRCLESGGAGLGEGAAADRAATTPSLTSAVPPPKPHFDATRPRNEEWHRRESRELVGVD